MINKYQAGGAAPLGSILQEIAKLPQEQQKKIMTAFGKWAQAKGLNIQQLQGNEQALEQAMGQFLQEMQQAPKARLGAKLNYVRSLRGLAPEGMVTEYYKEGGQVKKKFVKPAGGAKEKDGKKEIAEFKKKACGGSKMKFEPGGKAPKKEQWTKEDDKKLLKYRLRGTKNPAEKRDSTEVQVKWNRLPKKEKAKYEVQEQKCGGKTKKHQQGGVIGFFQAGGLAKRFSVSSTGKNGTTRYFDTEDQAKAYQSTLPSGSSVRRDGGKDWAGSVLKVDRTKNQSTAYARQKAETPYNNLAFKDAYNLARKNGVRWFAYKGKVYKSDLEGKAAKNNLTEMQAIYGNNLGWSGNPKMKTKASQQARAQYRKEVNTSEKGYTKEVKKPQSPYVSSYDGGELFANFMGLASPTRWVGAIGRASRGEGNTGTFVGKVLNNMLDPQNGARENQGIFSSGLSPADEKWAAEHPVASGITNGVIDAAVFGPKPKFTKDFKFKPNYGYKGRLYAVTQETVPMGIYEGDLNVPTGTALGKNPYVELGKQVGTTTKTVTKRKVTNPGTRYVKSVSEKPTGKYNFSWSEGMPGMFPWVTATTNNNVMK